MSDIGVGDTVSLTGVVVINDYPGSGLLLVKVDDDLAGKCWLSSSQLTLVEKAKPPVYSNSATEPQEGDWAVSPFGGWVIAMSASLWTFKDGTPERNQPKGPMRLLVRNGREFTGDAA